MEEVSAFFTLADVCCACGNPELVAARPGTDFAAVSDDFLTVPTIGWCAACAWDRDAAYAEAHRDLAGD